MRTFIILIVSWVSCLGALTEPIIYHFPEKVQSYIRMWVDSFDETKRKDVCFFLGSSRGNASGEYIFYLHLSTGRGSGAWGGMVERSNRWVSIGSTLYPIIVDYDEIYGISCDQDLGQLGTIGKRDGLIRRSKALFHGNTIYFDLKGKHVKCIPGLKKKYFSRDKSSKEKIEYVSPRDSALIVYIIPDRKELDIAAITGDNKFIFIHRNANEIVIEPVFDGDYSGFANNSRRCVLVDTKMTPLVFDYDLLFSNNKAMSYGIQAQSPK